MFSKAVLTDPKQEIINNLKVLNISEECTKRILAAVDSLPGKDHLLGALKFLTKITEQKSKRENYYDYSKFIAEFFCTISNLGLFAVGFYYGDFLTLLAATFSALSHAIPLQRLHDLDLLGVFLVFAKVMGNYNVLIEKPEVMMWGMGAVGINVLDMIVTRKHLDKIGPTLHVLWHFAAALFLYKLNQASTEITTKELEAINTAVLSSTVPGFLNQTFAQIDNYLQNFSCHSECVLF